MIVTKNHGKAEILSEARGGFIDLKNHFARFVFSKKPHTRSGLSLTFGMNAIMLSNVSHPLLEEAVFLIRKFVVSLCAVLVVCGGITATFSGGLRSALVWAEEPYHIAIMTPTLSSSEDEFRAGENMAKKYPGMVKHITHPDNFNAEIETTISQIVALADDPLMKAIVIASGGSGFLPAIQKVKEKRPDIIFVTAPIWDDPVLMAKNIDLCLDTDWVRRGETIARKAQKMGAKTLVHYSFPTHLAKEVIQKRKEMMEKTCKEIGVNFFEVVTPDPQAGDGVAAMQQFLREDLPRQIAKHGKDTNIFGTNCPMYDVIIDEAIKQGFIVAEQCCPTPLQAYPSVMGLEIGPEDLNNFDKVNKMISDYAAAHNMTGRLAGWPIPVTIYLPEFAVEVAKRMVDDKNFNPKESTQLAEFGTSIFGVGAEFHSYQDMANYQVMIMDSIIY